MKIDLQLTEVLLNEESIPYLHLLLDHLNELKEGPDTYVCISKDDIESLCELVVSKIKEREKGL